MSNSITDKILITGANGLVGTRLLSYFQEKGYQNVWGLARNRNSGEIDDKVFGDLSDLGSLEDALKGVKTVIHCAAIVSFDPRDKEELNKVNIEGTANLVNTCLSMGVSELLYISSVAALGKPSSINNLNKEVLINEDQKWADSPLNSHYAKSKYEGECEIWRGEAEGLKVAVVNPSIIIGEGDWDKSSSRLFKYVWDENRFLTSGFINYIDVDDIASIVEQIISTKIYGDRYILNGGKVSYREFFEMVASRFSKKAPTTLLSGFWIGLLWRIEYLRSILTKSKPLITRETAISASYNFYFDNSKIKEKLGFEFHSLETSLDRICKYYLTKKP